MNPDVIIVRYGELALKSPYTRKIFEQQLIRNISEAFSHKDIDYNIEKQWGRIYVHSKNIDEALKILENIFGITSISPAEKTDADIELISKKSLSLMNSIFTDQKSFALRVRRTGNHSFSSQDIAQIVGKKIDDTFPLHVDLKDPDIALFIEIRGKHAYLFLKKIRGPGGMPRDTQGVVLAYINDVQSLLASWYLLKRGCSIIFFVKEHYLYEKTQDFLKIWFTPAKLIEFDERKDIFQQLKQNIGRYHCSALISGVSFSQDQKETIEIINNLKSSIDVPLLLPLIAFSNDEIEKKSRSVGLAL